MGKKGKTFYDTDWLTRLTNKRLNKHNGLFYNFHSLQMSHKITGWLISQKSVTSWYKGASIDYVDKQGVGGVSQMSTILESW